MNQGHATFICDFKKMLISIATTNGITREDFIEFQSPQSCQEKATALSEIFSSYTRPVILAICRSDRTGDTILERRLLSLGSTAKNNTRMVGETRYLGVYTPDALQRLPDIRFRQTVPGDCQKQADLINSNAKKELPALQNP
jgi:hypothetical protein